jgi:RNA polymerase sigma-70 factor (ECF subfamily)
MVLSSPFRLSYLGFGFDNPPNNLQRAANLFRPDSVCDLEMSKKTTPSPDLFLARRAARADAEAWNQIIERCGERIWNVALRFAPDRSEAEDLTQEIFLKLYDNLSRYRGDVPLIAWTLRLSRNLCIDRYRHERSRLRAETPLDLTLHHPTTGEDPEFHSLRRENRLRVHRALARMSEGQAMLVMLRDLQGFAYEELAEIFEVPAGTIKSRLNRARRSLVRELQSELEAEDDGMQKTASTGGA